jgi:protein O-mannosyl-transferase
LLVAVGLCYANVLRAPFLFDDTGAILQNSTIRHLGSLQVLRPPADGSTTTGRPVVNLSFALNYAISGEEVWSYHALNIVIHALAALALFGVLRRTLRSPSLVDRFGPVATPTAFFGALLWAVHPLQTESVTCVAQRTESLCGLFYLLTLYGFIRGADRTETTRRWFFLSVVSCFLGMATKEVMVTAPLVVLLYDRTFFSGSFSAAWRQRRGYYLGLFSAWLLLAGLVAGNAGGRGSAAGFGLGISGWNYLLKQGEAVVLYLKLSLWPHPLVLDYGTAVTHSVKEVWWQGPVVLALLGATVWALVRKPRLGFVGAWFFMILAPSSSVVPLVTQTMAEHRMYLPVASVALLGVFAAYALFGRRAVWLLAGWALALGTTTFVRNRDYRDVVGIWADTVEKSPSNARAHNNLAWALQREGKSEEANAHFAKAIDLLPDYVAARYSWGVALLDQGRSSEAIAQFEAAVKLAPRHADAHLNLGNALMQVRRPDEAITHYEVALQIQPAADVHYNLGIALAEVGRGNEAQAHLEAALKANPSLPEAHYRLARLAERGGRLAEAEQHYSETLRLAPSHAGAHAALGLILAQSDRVPAAVEHLQTAVRLQPADPDLRANLGNVFLLQGRPREAIACYEESLRLRPNDRRTLQNLQLAREALR